MLQAVDFWGEINDSNISALRDFVTINTNITELRINISSLGGSLFSGVTIYNFLKKQPFKIITHNGGEVTSAAVLLYLAGTTRTAEPISKFLIHPPSIRKEEALAYNNIRELLKGLEADIENYAAIVNNETNCLNGKYEVKEFLKGDSLVLNRSEAFACGIVTQLDESSEYQKDSVPRPIVPL